MAPVHWMGIIPPVKSFMAYNICCIGTSTLKNVTVLLGLLTALLEYFDLKVCKFMQNWFWFPEYTYTVSGNLRNLCQCYSSAQATFPIACKHQ